MRTDLVDSTKRKPIIATLLLLATVGCSVLPTAEPYYVEPPQTVPLSGVTIDYELLSICYSSAVTKPERIREMAAAACRNPEFVRNDYAGDCTLQLPVRATYRCSAVNHRIAILRKPFRTFKDQPRFPGRAAEEPSLSPVPGYDPSQ